MTPTPTPTEDASTDTFPPEDAWIVPIPPAVLLPHPANPRGSGHIPREAVADLMASIEANGQRQPCLVRPISPSRTVEIEGPVGPAQLYEIVLGRRRARACELLGRDVLCMVAEGERALTDDQALAIMVSEQAVKSDPDPLLEAEAVAAFLGRPGWTLQGVAEQLGKSVRWVAQRSNLRTLSEGWRKLRADPKSQVASWPVGWLEEVAALAPEVQEGLAEEAGNPYSGHAWSHQVLREEIEERLHILGSAKWDLDDATLVPRAGACTTCPKTSARSPGLFDEADLDPARPEDLARATCRDAKCWREKAERTQLIAIEKLRADAGGKTKVAVVRGSWDAAIPGLPDGVRHGTPAKEVDGGVIESYDATQRKVKANTKGAIPALVLGGKDDGKTMWVMPEGKKAPPEARKGAGAKGDGATKDTRSEKERLAESQTSIRRRREGHVVDLVREAVSVMPPPPFETVCLLLPSFALSDAKGCGWGAQPKKRDEVLRRVTKGSQDLASREVDRDAWAAEIWHRGAQGDDAASRGAGLCGAIVSALRRAGGSTHDDEHALALWIAEILAIDADGYARVAFAEIPDPKWWPESARTVVTQRTVAEAVGKPTKATAAKTAKKTAAAKPAKASTKKGAAKR